MSEMIGVKVSDLVPTYATPEENPNKMEPERFTLLHASIAAKGAVQTILVTPIDGGKYRIVDGHHRYWAAKLAALFELPAIVHVFTGGEAEERAARIAMNRLRGDLDLTQCAELLKEIVMDTGWSTDEMSQMTGFTDDEVESLLAKAKTSLEDLQGADVGKMPDDTAAPADKPFVLEIAFSNREDYKLCRKKLRKAAGPSKDLAQGLLAVLGEES